MGLKFAQRTSRPVSAGDFHPLGATLKPEGINFALYSQSAEEVWLFLYDRPDGEPTDSIRLKNRTRFVWHACVEGLKAGQLYAYRVRGPFKPEFGLRFNENKLLMDPYARGLTGEFINKDNLLLAYDPDSPDQDLSLDKRDNAGVVPKSVVVDEAFDWKGDRPPAVALEEMVIYEVHPKGFTAHPSSGVKASGTYLGFIEKIPHLKSLGVNAVELLPVHENYDEHFLTARDRTNYWGYNSTGFFLPEGSYAAGGHASAGREFKTLVRALHKAGMAVILDVVYNHTAEGSELGPTLNLRGIDNPTYYALSGPEAEPERRYLNFSGCGNSLNAPHQQVIRIIMDSLRYWVEVMRVDGFRFDLASVLGRKAAGYERSASFFDAIGQDPVLNRVHLIAEPWDVGTYQVGNFPVEWSEWNGRFRDTARRFVKGDRGQLSDLGQRLTGSADLYGEDGRHPYHSVNFITCHDGFTLNDLVSYEAKHNEANGEDNRDGSDANDSWNCGVEGETDDPAILELRLRLAKNHVCLLLFSCGTPMLLAGDEFLQTQRGNNNAYCQDNELAWLDWGRAKANAGFTDFVRKAIAFRRRRPSLRRRYFFTGTNRDRDGAADITWYGPDLEPPAWNAPEARAISYRIDADEDGPDSARQLFFILNSEAEPRDWRLPPPPPGARWLRAVDTSLPLGEDILPEGREAPLAAPDRYRVPERTVVVLVAR